MRGIGPADKCCLRLGFELGDALFQELQALQDARHGVLRRFRFLSARPAFETVYVHRLHPPPGFCSGQALLFRALPAKDASAMRAPATGGAAGTSGAAAPTGGGPGHTDHPTPVESQAREARKRRSEDEIAEDSPPPPQRQRPSGQSRGAAARLQLGPYLGADA